MKLSEAKILNEKQLLESAELMRNPSNQTQWFITLSLKDGQRFFLANEDDEVIVDSELENLLNLLKTLGFHTARIAL